MPEPFKNLFNKTNIRGMGQHYAKAWPEFELEAFVAAATKDMESLELKERSAQITEAMATYLPADFEKAAAIMLASLAPAEETNIFADVDERGIAGFLIMSMTHYVGLHGLGHFDISMNLLKEMTIRSTSEFGIRFFLLDDPERTLSVLEAWTTDPNQHVRRLVSEGSRTRLPWAMRLPAFMADPAPVIHLLELLKDDDEEYVRRSVANNLNDIAKDHPDLVAEIASQWLKGAEKNRERLVRHACRTLIKQGHQATLKAFGYNKARVEVDKLEVLNSSVAFGSALEFELGLTSASADSQPLIIDYAIHHQKANGSTSPKVFKWKTLTLERHATLVAKRRHPMKMITTRVYYPGTHKLEILINGTSVGVVDFELIIKLQRGIRRMEQFLPSFTWNNPTRVIFGVGRLAELRGLVDEIAGEDSRIFLVTGRSSLKARGILQRVLDSLGEGRVTLFDQASPYPSPSLADMATAQCREAGCEIVVAIGGGSVMDLAKVVALLSNKEGLAQEFSAGERVIEGPGLPFIAVPTTSGSSSEVTMSSALWDREGKQHMGLSSRHMFPTVAIVDPEMTMSMSKTLVAVTGMDAFTSAIESYWSTEAEPMTDGINLQVIQMFHINLDRSSIQGDIESRANCAMAATMSGIAYSNSRPNACHAVGIPLTLHWDVEHGQAVSVTLTSLLRWAAPGIPHKMPALYAALGAQDLDGVCARITQIMTRCGLETRLSGLGLGEGDIDTLVENTRWDRTRTLPRPLGQDDLRSLLTELL